MKRFFTILLCLLLLAALLAGAAWYFLSYNLDWTQGFLKDRAASYAASERYDRAIQIYTWAEKLVPMDQDTDVRLAECYRASGNYTKAEYTLSNAIFQGADADVYEALCRVYVEQDKLLDAVAMLDQIADAGIKAQLDAIRPQAPTALLEPGFYNQYMDVDFEYQGGTLCVSLDRNYPSVNHPFTEPVTLNLGETTATALVVGDNGLVSPLAIFGYTIAGVVEPVTLADPMLDAAVREILSRGSASTLTTADLWSITELDVTPEITDLSQMGYFTGLSKLTLQGREDVDLSFLSKMPYLTALDLENTLVNPEQLSIIGGLSQLEELNLSGCQLSTLTGLEPLTNLKTVKLSMNSISNLSPIGGSLGIKTLIANNNAISTAAPISGLTGLETLDLSNNLLRDLRTLSACVSLKSLDVSFNNLTTLGGINTLTNLEHFAAASNSLETAEGIGACTALRELDLNNNHLTEMEEISTLGKVEVLDVSYNDIVTIPDFPNDAALSVFNGCHNFFENVSGLADLEHLNYVYLDYNNVSDINVLSGCEALVQVNIFRTNVTDISQLEDMDIIISYNPT